MMRRGRALLASAALVAASLCVPASANAQDVTYNAWCVQYFKNWCAGHWQAENFTSFTACWDFYKELQCRYEW
jgi:hypothetical protein